MFRDEIASEVRGGLRPDLFLERRFWIMNEVCPLADLAILVVTKEQRVFSFHATRRADQDG